MDQHPASFSPNGPPPEPVRRVSSQPAPATPEPATPNTGAGVGVGADEPPVPDVGWSVGVVAERLGIAAPTLRSWDRRHGVGPSLRTGGNHRRYTEADIRRVLLMSRLTAQGVPAQSAADAVLSMRPESISTRLAAVSPGTDGADEAVEADVSAAEVVESIIAAAASLDGPTLSHLYGQVLRQRDVGQAWTEVFAPALRRVGTLWSEGRLGVASEHLCSELLQSELRAVVRAHRPHRGRVGGRPVLLASADDEQHHLPLLALEAELARHGVAGLFLGPRVPTEAVLVALRETRLRVIFLWASLPRPESEPLWRELAALDWPLEVVIGGPGWSDGIELPGRSVTTMGQVTLTRVEDFGSAVRSLTSSAGAPSADLGR